MMDGREFWEYVVLLAAVGLVVWRVLVWLAESFDSEFEAVEQHRRQMEALSADGER